jgi:hypothetical protein
VSGPRERSLDRLIRSAALLTAVIALAPFGIAQAAESGGTVVPVVSTTEVPAEPAPLPETRKLSAFVLELRQAVDAERAALVLLQARFDRATNEGDALAIQREIETLKQNGEVQLLRIQAKHARLKGREAAARKIEAAIEAMLHPVPTPASPVVRPAPAEARSGSR